MRNRVANNTENVYVAMLGARGHYAVPRLLYEAGLLGRFYTDNYIGNKPWFEWILRSVPQRLHSKGIERLLERKDPVLPGEKVKSYDFLGFWYSWRLSRVRNTAELIEVVAERAFRFNQKIIESGGMEEARVIWGFNGAALELFEWAKSKKIRCVLEQTIAPRVVEIQLLSEELERWPDWEPGLRLLLEGDARSEREKREWEQADRIVGGSQFVVDGLKSCDVPASKCKVIPYGVDVGRFGVTGRTTGGAGGRPLRVLFIGEVGLRKGAPYLLEALKMLGPTKVEARFVGGVVLSRDKIIRYQDVVKILGPLPRSEIPKNYSWADVFCIPSICEGSATTTYEALSAGLPVVATPNTGSIIQDGVNGFIVPIRNPEAIAGALERYQLDRQLLQTHIDGTVKALEHISLEAYGGRLVNVIREVMSE